VFSYVTDVVTRLVNNKKDVVAKQFNNNNEGVVVAVQTVRILTMLLMCVCSSVE